MAIISRHCLHFISHIKNLIIFKRKFDALNIKQLVTLVVIVKIKVMGMIPSTKKLSLGFILKTFTLQ